MPFVLIGVKVNEAYLEYVVMLNSKLRYIQDDVAPPDGSSLGLAPPETAAVQEVLPELEKLRLRAVSKVRQEDVLIYCKYSSHHMSNSFRYTS